MFWKKKGKKNEKKKISALAKLARLWALLYYAFAKEIIEKLGDEKGHELLVSCIRKYAKIRGEEIAKHVNKKGLPYDAKSFVENYDSSWLETQEACLELFPDKKIENAPGTTFCPYKEIWDLVPKGREMGLIYCEEFHKAMWAAYHPELRLDQHKIMTKGDEICTFETYMEGEKERSIAIFDQKKQLKEENERI